MNRLLLVAFCILTVSLYQLHAQCINTFPYNEGFENGDGGWFSGGTNSDWVMGQPSKNTITNAATGSNCWITGGLAGSSYNAGESSYVQSPCFDLSALQYPIVSFFVYWETEQRYDGGSFQYSIDGGLNWNNVGSYGKPSTCMNSRWYNEEQVIYLSALSNTQQGWSGNSKNTQGSCQGGGGSGSWVSAVQCLTQVKGQSNVIFRFTFGAGTTCNNYDGFAFDDIYIAEGPPNLIDFAYTCNGNTVNFTNALISSCPDTLLWTFSDGGTATGLNVTHTFTGGGTHSATLYAAGPCNAPATVTKQFELIDVSAVAQNVSCNGYADGSGTVTVTPAGSYTYGWNTTPVQNTATAGNLPAGSYTVVVSGAATCAATANLTITEPEGIISALTSTPDTCTGGGGTAQVTASGGTTPYVYQWSNGGGNTATIQNLDPGTYTVTITDSAGCSVSNSVAVDSIVGFSINFATVRNVSCYADKDGKIDVLLNGGTMPYVYTWSNNAGTANLNRLEEGVYALTVTDANNCTVADSVLIEKDICRSYVYFPTGFTPNGDGINDKFKPKYSADLEKYNIRVYNRWGELVYESTDINEGWNGYYKGMLQPLGVYVWLSEYRFTDNEPHSAAGNITLTK